MLVLVAPLGFAVTDGEAIEGDATGIFQIQDVVGRVAGQVAAKDDGKSCDIAVIAIGFGTSKAPVQRQALVDEKGLGLGLFGLGLALAVARGIVGPGSDPNLVPGRGGVDSILEVGIGVGPRATISLAGGALVHVDHPAAEGLKEKQDQG